MRQFYNYLAALAVFLLLTITAFGGEREAVHWLGNGTGFVLRAGKQHFMVSIRHCGDDRVRTFKIGQRHVKAVRKYKPDGPKKENDGPVVYELEPGTYEALPFSLRDPHKGDLIYTIGYPSGYWTKSYGRVLGYDDGEMITDHKIAPGQSGGPILNECGEVVGISQAAASGFYEARSYFSTRGTLEKALCQSVDVKPEVVVFSIPDCRGCAQLEADYNAGKFPGYTFTFVKHTHIGWTHPDLVKEFRESCQVPAKIGYPIIWVRGTPNYKAGYGESRGLLGWLVDAVRDLIRGLIGGENKQQAPFTPVPDPEFSPAPNVDQEGQNLGEGGSDEPVSPLWGLLGVLTGVLHRRYA